MSKVMDRRSYVAMFGPTKGDRVRLGDTDLIVEVEQDFAIYGEECKFGGGKVLRDGMGQCVNATDEPLELLITNALIVDYTGIIKADVGIRVGRIVGIGKAGNPDITDNITPGMTVGATTEVIAGENRILTAGAIDSHIHFICPQQINEALASGITTMIGGGTGPSAGTNATTCTPGASAIEMMLQATDAYPLNFGFLGKGNCSDPVDLRSQVRGGALGLKLHEDWGTTPAAIDCCLDVAEEFDIQVCIHTDTLNESGFVETSCAALKGRTIHTYHTEGAGGGHAPDIMKLCGELNVLPSSTNPTRPFTINTIDEHLDMLMVCHHLDKAIPEDIQFAESRIRGETMAAEDILHDMGALAIMASDSQAMGRVGEVIIRTWQTADKMKKMRGSLSPDRDRNDNFRVKRYIAKYTINPALAHGVSHQVGSIEPGKLADLSLWRFDMFGVRPEMVIKGGVIAWANMGDPNASIPPCQPTFGRPMFGAKGLAPGKSSIAFVSKASLEKVGGYGLNKMVDAVKGCRTVTKKDLKLNDYLPNLEIDPEAYKVVADGVHLTCDPARKVALGQLYHLF